MINGAERLALLAGGLTFGATGMALALTGLGVPFLLSSLLSAAGAGFVQYAALRRQKAVPDTAGPQEASQEAAEARLEAYRASVATLRHDLRGIMSPALMMSDRLLKHADPSVVRAGQAVVRSIERATALLATNKDVLSEKDV